jgi:hypothetical protein
MTMPDFIRFRWQRLNRVWRLCSGLAALLVLAGLGLLCLVSRVQGDDPLVPEAVIHWGAPEFTQGDDYDAPGPDWWLGASKIGGEWTNGSWHVAAAESNGVGQLEIYLDPKLLATNNVRLDVILFDHAGSSLYVDLLDTNDAVVATNLYGNLLEGSNEIDQVTVEIPLTNYPAATTIQLRRDTGEITV